MFTGIVEAVGTIRRVKRAPQGLRIAVHAGRLDTRRIQVGDSVCVQGVCLTVTARRGKLLRFDVSGETLRCSSGLEHAGAVNLERSLRLGDALGGHLVSGHVDGTGEVLAFERVGESRLLRIRSPARLSRYLAPKGSICVNGVSLTVNRVRGNAFDVNLIPHTLRVTTLGRLTPGASVNLEADLVARYVERMLGQAEIRYRDRRRAGTSG